MLWRETYLEIRKCRCRDCISLEEHPNKKLHHNINLKLSRLDEQKRRWFVANEAMRIGYGGISQMSIITGIDRKTISKGIKEIENGFIDKPIGRIRKTGGGRKLTEKKTY